jgi:DNA gyrase subunit A
VRWLKVYEIPQAGRGARGKPIQNLLHLADGEKITAILPVREYTAGTYVFMATSDGTVKKTELTEFSRPRASGIIAIDLQDGNQLVDVGLTQGGCDVLLFSDAGKVIRFPEDDVRPMGRSARGVRGILLQKGQSVIAQIIACPEGASETAAVLTATRNGYGKRTPLVDYPKHHRGGQGVISIQVTERNGPVVGACIVEEEDEVMLISSGGVLIRTRVKEISVVGRNTQGVNVMEMSVEEHLVGMEKVAESEGE